MGQSLICSRSAVLSLSLYPLRLLDPANTMQFDDFKKCYGEILHRWGLKDKRAEVLKFTSCPPEPHKGIEFGVYCCHCRSQVRGTQCAVCSASPSSVPSVTWLSEAPLTSV
uniref:GATOR complex protein WDR59-like n=1 Tax=Oncorhynchus gorbuscha TaxID=8017 RepID=UPI001EAF1350|nr:GATOR complex protein WDR59-like [Oncorhynchus gorbuscha]